MSLNLRHAALVLLLAGCATTTPPAPSALKESEEMIDLAGLDLAYRWTDPTTVSAHGLPSVAVEDLSSLRVRRLARQVASMSRLVRRSASVRQQGRDMAERCEKLAAAVLGFSSMPLPEQLFVEGRACAEALVAVGGGPNPARPLVGQAEKLARYVAVWLDTPYAAREARR